jgi:hypothetical protein
MTADRRPLPADLNALKGIIGGRPADPQTMQRLITCKLVEEFDGIALLTSRGIEAAALLLPTSNEVSPPFVVQTLTGTPTVLARRMRHLRMMIARQNGLGRLSRSMTR